MSVAHTGKLQENTAALCKKWLQNSPGERYQYCAKWLWNSLGKRYQQIRICLSGEVETPSFPIRCQAPDVKHPEKVARHPDRIPDVGYLERMERHQDRISRVGYPKKMERHPYRIPRVHGVGTQPEQLHPDSPSGHASLANITHPDDSSSYSDTTLAIIVPYFLYSGFAYGKGLQSFGSSCFWAFHCFAMDSK